MLNSGAAKRWSRGIPTAVIAAITRYQARHQQSQPDLHGVAQAAGHPGLDEADGETRPDVTQRGGQFPHVRRRDDVAGDGHEPVGVAGLSLGGHGA